MAITVKNYGLFLQSLVEGRVAVDVDDMWCMLVTNSYIFQQDTHKFKSVVTGEVVGSGYTTGGKIVTIAGTSYNSGTNTLNVPAGNMAWPAVTFSGVVGAILYMRPDGAPDNAMPLVSYISFGESISRTAEAFYINWPATGVLKLTTP